MNREQYTERLAESLFRIERYEASAARQEDVLDQAGVRGFLATSRDNLQPLAHQMAIDVLAAVDPDLASTEELSRIVDWRAGSGLPYPGESAIGDLFLFGSCVAHMVIRERHLFEQTCKVELSLLYFGKRPASLTEFIERITKALVASDVLDEGSVLERVKPQPDDTTWMDQLDNMVPFERLDGERIRASLALSDRETRERIWKAKGQSVEKASFIGFERFDAAGLLSHHFVRQCRDGRPGYVGSSLQDVERADILCTICRKDALTHPLGETVTPSDLAQELTDGSRWMIELSALSLVIAGVPRGSIRVPAPTRAPDPIDLAFMLDGYRYVCELKDRPVTAADAGRFLGRARALPPHRALIITTESVEGDALRVLDPPSNRFNSTSSRSPRIIEGSDCLPEGLRWELVFCRLRDFASEVRLTGPGSALNPYQLLLSYFGTVWRTDDAGAETSSSQQAYEEPARATSNNA